MEKKVIIYHDYIPRLGGIESAVYNLAKGLDRKGYEVVVAYRSAETHDSLFRYAEVSDVVCVAEEKVKGDVCLVASNHSLNSNIEADRYLQWIHSDYAKYNLRLKNIGDIETYVAVSNHAKDVIEEQEGISGVKVIPNLMDKGFGKKKNYLKLVTCSRVSPEKGFGRMLVFANLLQDNGIDFIWTVYGDNSHYPNEYQNWIEKFKTIEGVYFVGYKSDITPALSEADYLVQLSDWEGCPYAILEALKMEKPCIVTNWGGVEEIIKDGKNGYILPMEIDNYESYLEKIVNNIPKFKYKSLSSINDWIKIIEDEV
jgi:glycosyltransferase involved in cell wall biosynthesis